jgi:hypothetical protein
LRGERIVEEFLVILESYVATRYPSANGSDRVQTRA